MESRYVLTRLADDLFAIPAASPRDAQALAAQIRRSGTWLEVVPGIDSVVVRFDAVAVPASDAETLLEITLSDGVELLSASDTLVEIPVVYGGDYGPDLGELSRKTGFSIDQVIALHTGQEYEVDMVGFTPGFAFIGGLDDRLRVPRRSEPRQRVPAGSVGVADGRTGLYAMASPGGWTLIGRTPLRLFDPDARRPFALEPGMRVRFRAIAAEDYEA
ncbi:MAG: 5-oxoprolinase subunit PxpB [Gammaproteobacteria bacterium]|nr:5-oxoprolinase subunit PxpB [Gammaproteobacteria bacterium]